MVTLEVVKCSDSRCNLEEDKLGLDVGEERGQGCFKA